MVFSVMGQRHLQSIRPNAMDSGGMRNPTTMSAATTRPSRPGPRVRLGRSGPAEGLLRAVDAVHEVHEERDHRERRRSRVIHQTSKLATTSW